jgi:hypothetical protein
MKRAWTAFLACSLPVALLAASRIDAQGTTQRAARLVQAPTRPGAPASQVEGSLLQVMRGIVYPASNVVFAGQEDFSKLPRADDPSTSPNPLTSTYGGWQAIESAGIALSESATLLLLPGRSCSNGRPVPVQRADWRKYVDDLRAAGRTAYKAAQSRNQDTMVEAAGTVADACEGCHDVYRERGGAAGRCTPK